MTGFAILVLLRLPNAWLHGRFMGEEGTIFFAYAWHRPAIEAIFHTFGGYLNVGANTTTLLAVLLVRANLMPLEQAPYVTMTLALAMQLLPAVLVVTGRACWLANRWAVVVILLIFAMAPMTEEVFSNVLHIQFHLALCVALILALDVPRSLRARSGYGAILVLAPLCGPGAMIVLPLLGLRSLVDRDRARLTQTALLAAGTAVQLMLFFHSSPARGDFLGPVTLASILFVKLLALPMVGAAAANALGHGIYVSRMAGGIGWWCVAAAAAVGYFGWLLVVAFRARSSGVIWLLLAALAIAMVSFSGGMIHSGARAWFSAGFGERYNFLPIVLLSCGITGLAAQSDVAHRRGLLCLLGLTLASGAATYFRPFPDFRDGPSWSREVDAWRRDHNHLLATWPASWRVDLSDHRRSCSSPRPNPIGTSDPSYCESAWLARTAEDMSGQNQAAD